ncbi:MAG: hypothetical protein MSG64_04370 [Pyrinomonadaceae bacterium MAG19_C2-C3]|nr:hypothetical protein [Pyrinomonadaceae bacterium MAG19_C2-C3]
MSRNFKYTALCVSIFLFVLTVGTWIKVRLDLTDGEVEQLIKSEVPDGASKSQVRAFLDAHQIGYSDYVRYRQTNPKQDTDFQSEKLKDKAHLIEGYIFADIRSCGRWTFFMCDIYITFYFDAGGNMVAYQVKAVQDGP